MRYVEALIEFEERDDTYRDYISDALKVISESVSKIMGGQYINKRYYDIIKPSEAQKEAKPESTDRLKSKLRRG